MSLSDSKSLKCWNFFPERIKHWDINKSFCPTSVSFKHTVICIQRWNIFKEYSRPEWWTSVCQPAQIYTSAYTVRHFLYSHDFFSGNCQGLQMDSFPCISSQLSVSSQADTRLTLGCSLCTHNLGVGALCRISRTQYEAVIFKDYKELCGQFGTLTAKCWCVSAAGMVGAMLSETSRSAMGTPCPMLCFPSRGPCEPELASSSSAWLQELDKH